MKTALLQSNQITVFSADNYHRICNDLAQDDKELQSILDTYGFPPMWTRPNTFETLVHIILEQQVSLASAMAALKKLQEKTGQVIPAKILALSDDELRACYVSRQKSGYIRGLAHAINNGSLLLQEMENEPDENIRIALSKLKGIGNWTVDVYLMFVLQRADVFPIGDLAAVNALKKLKGLSRETGREQVIEIARNWSPYRSVACMMLWHYYLSGGSKS